MTDGVADRAVKLAALTAGITSRASAGASASLLIVTGRVCR